MKFSLIGLHLASVLQFTETPHFVQRRVVLENGDIVNINSGAAHSLSFSSSTEKDKKKFVINVVVSTGPGLYNPILSTFPDKETKDRVLAGLKKGLEVASSPEGVDAPEVVAPDAE